MTRTQMFKYVGIALALVLAAFAAWQWSDWRMTARAGSAYAARIVCSCRYVAGRTMESCARDIAEDAGAVHLNDDPAARRVTGTVPLLGRGSAVFRPGFGCVTEQP